MLFNLSKKTLKVLDSDDSKPKQNTPKPHVGSFMSPKLNPEVQHALDGIKRMWLDVSMDTVHLSWWVLGLPFPSPKLLSHAPVHSRDNGREGSSKDF